MDMHGKHVTTYHIVEYGFNIHPLLENDWVSHASLILGIKDYFCTSDDGL